MEEMAISIIGGFAAKEEKAAMRALRPFAKGCNR